MAVSRGGTRNEDMLLDRKEIEFVWWGMGRVACCRRECGTGRACVRE